MCCQSRPSVIASLSFATIFASSSIHSSAAAFSPAEPVALQRCSFPSLRPLIELARPTQLLPTPSTFHSSLEHTTQSKYTSGFSHALRTATIQAYRLDDFLPPDPFAEPNDSSQTDDNAVAASEQEPSSSLFAEKTLTRATKKPKISPTTVENPDNSVDQPKPTRPPRRESDVFSMLPARLASIQRVKNPSEFKSTVIDDQDRLVVVRFYADICPACRATGPLFRKWSRELESTNAENSSPPNRLPIKIVEMPLNKETSSFLQETLHVERLPLCRVYHPKLGLVEEDVVISSNDFRDFVSTVDVWSTCETEAETAEADEQSGRIYLNKSLEYKEKLNLLSLKSEVNFQ